MGYVGAGHTNGRRWRSNPSGKCSQERLKRGTVTSTMRRPEHPSGCAKCGAGAGCSAIKYQFLKKSKRAAYCEQLCVGVGHTKKKDLTWKDRFDTVGTSEYMPQNDTSMV